MGANAVKLRWPWIAVFCLILAFAPAAFGQFISRDYYPLWGEDYENYGSIGYRDALQPIMAAGGRPGAASWVRPAWVRGFGVELERRQYDPFGHYLVDGLDIFRLQEFRTIAPNKGSIVFKSALYANIFQNLVIASDQISGLASRIIIGDAIRTKFTPLTLDLTRLNGVRWDAATRKNRFTVLGSRISNPGRIRFEDAREFATYLYGGRWENTLGDILTLGISYVTLFRTDTLLRGSHIQRGVVPTDLGGVQDLYVIFSDDSPEDGAGAEVHQMEIYINGEKAAIQPEIALLPQVDMSIKFSPNVLDKRPLPPEYLSYFRADGPWLLQAINYNTSVAPLRRLQQLLDKNGVLVFFNGGRPLEANATDVLVFKYAIPSEARSVRFRALVANDYSIDVGTTLKNWDDWHNVKRARNQERSRSNLGWVSFEYGFPSGLVTYGMDVDLRVLGAHIRAEVDDNISYYAYPGTGGDRQRRQVRPYFIHFFRPFDRLDVGAEVFDMPASYTTSFPTIEPRAAAQPVGFTPLVEDNDDRDEWADAVDQDGVFPGLDEDRDGVIDTNVNRNGIPDYLEPFLMYYVDPDDFVYGDDFNNNGVVDAREDDNRPDYPYNLDRRGLHLFSNLWLAPNLRNTIGRYQVRRPAGGGRNRVIYDELAYTAAWQDLGELKFNYLLKRVRDDIPDDVRGGFLTTTGFVSEGAIRPDLRALRNSLVHLLYLETQYTGIPGLNVVNKLRYEINDQRADEFADGTFQEKARKRDWAVVSRADYSWRRGDLTLTPMVKLRLQKKIRPSSGRDPFLYTRHLIPILRLDYAFGRTTVLRVGFQGFPLKEQFRNKAWPFNRYDATGQVVAFQNRGNYSGFDLSLNMGWVRTRREFRSEHSSRSGSNSELFIQVFME